MRFRSGGGREVAGLQPPPDGLSDPVPLALLEAAAPEPGRLLLHEGPPLGIFRVESHHFVGHGLDLVTGYEPRPDRPLQDRVPKPEHDGRGRNEDDKPLQREHDPVGHASLGQEQNVPIYETVTFVDGTSWMSERFVPMLSFASRLRQRAEELGISNAEVARRVGLSERRYAHYVSGKREPDLATLVKIAEVLGTTPNWLLSLDVPGETRSDRSLLLDRLNIAASTLSAEALRITVLQAEALARSNQE